MSEFFQVREHRKHHIGSFLADIREPTSPLAASELLAILWVMRKGLARSRSATAIPVCNFPIHFSL